MNNELSKQRILIVDDARENLDVLFGLLHHEYQISMANNGIKAIKITRKILPDLILLDIMMPEMDGYEVCTKLKGDPLTKNIPIIFVTVKDQESDEIKGFELGAVDYITKPISPIVVKTRVKTQLALYNQQRELSNQVNEKTKEIYDTRLKTINMLGLASEYKDNETGKHVTRMSQYSYHIAKEYGFSEDEAQLLLNASPMHDLGKISIPDSILQKPGKLDNDEFKAMQEHCTVGKKILETQTGELFVVAAIVAAEHHEKWNGKGYPNGISGEDIDVRARIVAIADVFDALISDRPYKKAWAIDRAVNVINQDAGTHFDPQLVKAFNKVLPRLLEIKEKYNS